MKLKRTVVAPVLVTAVALVSGGWLLQREVTGQDNVYQQARVFDEVLHLLSDRHVDRPKSPELYQMAVEGMIREMGDPHTTFLTAEEYADLYTEMSGQYAGIGAQIAHRDGWATVIAPLPGAPAERAGIRPGDRIVEIEGKSTKGLSEDETVKQLRGPKGTAVNIRILRFGVDELIPFRLVREEIKLRSVPYAYMLGDGIGYTRLSVFSGNSTDELRAALQKLRGEGMTKLILDLRENPGGLLEQGVSISDLFLPAGDVVVEVRARRPQESVVARASDAETGGGMPIVVLVDEYSASAAEIVAGALQDHDRALVVGARTFGKGSVQDLFPLSGGNVLKVTTAKWYTPVGRSIQRDRPKAGETAPVAADTPVDRTGTPVPAAGQDTAAKKPYRTDSGRIVYGGGGIIPDVVLQPDTATRAEQEFFRAAAKAGAKFNTILFNYALEVGRKNPSLTPSFQVTPEMRAELFQRLTAGGVAVTREQYEGARSFIDRRLGEEVVTYKFGQAAAAQRMNSRDRVVQGAMELLRRASTQQALFQAAQAKTAAGS